MLILQINNCIYALVSIEKLLTKKCLNIQAREILLESYWIYSVFHDLPEIQFCAFFFLHLRVKQVITAKIVEAH